MSELAPIRKLRKRRDYMTFDLEWVPAEPIPHPKTDKSWGRVFSEPLQLRVAGVYDGKEFRYYLSIDEFLERELVEENKGKWIYAHAGGLADSEFVLDRIIAAIDENPKMAQYRVNACFSGSSAIIIKVKKGKHTFTFVDSFWLLRASLAKIGKALGMDKLAEEERQTAEERRKWYAEVAFEKLLPYNEQDCRILYEAIRRFEDQVLALGGELKSTIASTGMTLFRRRFLKRTIQTSAEINAIGEEAYYASRVEVFGTSGTDFSIFDINSSFPFAMTFPCPGSFLGFRKTVRPSAEIFFVDCEFEVPEMFFPPIPFRSGHRLFFPTGRWRAWLTGIDFQLIEQIGGTVHKVHKVAEFEAIDDLRDYAETLYNARINSEAAYEIVVYKFLLNACYGKFAEGEEKEGIVINPKKIDRKRMQMVMPGVWAETKESNVVHRHVPIAAWITAIARRTLWGYLMESERLGSPSLYCDTDSIATAAQISCGEKLGQMKEETVLYEGEYAAPKVYRGRGKQLQRDGNWKEIYLNKAKGFSLDKDPAVAAKQLADIIEGKEIVVQRMARIKELFNEGETRPRETLVRKRLRIGETVTKRYHYDDGTTRPWTLDELHNKQERGML